MNTDNHGNKTAGTNRAIRASYHDKGFSLSLGPLGFSETRNQMANCKGGGAPRFHTPESSP